MNSHYYFCSCVWGFGNSPPSFLPNNVTERDLRPAGEVKHLEKMNWTFRLPSTHLNNTIIQSTYASTPLPFLSLNISTYLHSIIHPFIRLLAHPFNSSVQPSLHPATYLSVYSTIHLFIHLLIRPSNLT